MQGCFGLWWAYFAYKHKGFFFQLLSLLQDKINAEVTHSKLEQSSQEFGYVGKKKSLFVKNIPVWCSKQKAISSISIKNSIKVNHPFYSERTGFNKRHLAYLLLVKRNIYLFVTCISFKSITDYRWIEICFHITGRTFLGVSLQLGYDYISILHLKLNRITIIRKNKYINFIINIFYIFYNKYINFRLKYHSKWC